MKNLEKRRQLSKFYFQVKGGVVNVVGKSMSPTIRQGWKVKLEPVRPELIDTEDIIVFERDIFICHRIVAKIRFGSKIYFLHKGDNSNIGGILTEQSILGKVIEVFDEDSCKVDKKRWQFNSTKNINFLHFVYLFLYLIKRFIWKENKNHLSCSINRIFWRKILKFI